MHNPEESTKCEMYSELIFFDTFSHESDQEPNFDLVQFANPVYINEIRIVPLGAKVEADFPGGVRLGATNPSSFNIQLFINDLTNPSVCTFSDYGKFDYKQNVNIQFIPNERKPTDGLLIYGSYRTLTLAIFGEQTSVDAIMIKDKPISEPAQQENSFSANNENNEEIEVNPSEITQRTLDQAIDNTYVKSPEPVSNIFDQESKYVKSTKFKNKDKIKESPTYPNVKSPTLSFVVDNDSPRQRKRKSPAKRPCSPRSRSRSPRSIRSRSPSPWFRKNSPSSTVSLSCSYRSRSPIKLSPPRTPPSNSPTFKRKRKSPEIINENRDSENILLINTDLLDPISPEQSLSDLAENISDEENFDEMELDTCFKQSEAFESISSEEEYFDDGNPEADFISYSDFEMNDFSYIWTLDPFICDNMPLKYLRDPSKTVYEHVKKDFDQDKQVYLLSLLKKQDERSCIWVENVEILTKDLHHLPLDDADTLKKVLIWLIDAIDFDRAFKQPKVPYKVRHLKAGIKLAIALFGTCESVVSELLKIEIPQILMNLYNKPHMSLPLKLLIIRGIDSLCDTCIGVEFVLFHKSYKWESNGNTVAETCYQKLLNLILSGPATRLMVALTSLMKKIHYYELLSVLNNIVMKKKIDSMKAENLSHILEEISVCFVNAKEIMAQNIRHLPASAFFEVRYCSGDIYLAIYKWFKNHDLIECLIKILNSPLRNQMTRSVRQLIETLCLKDHFPLFLLGSECVATTNELISILTSSDDEDQSNNTGIKLNYLLKAFSLVDQLFAYIQNKDIISLREDNEVCNVLHRLFSLTFTPLGRHSVVKCFTSGDNFKVILTFLTSNGECEVENKFISVATEYACELCLLTLQLSENTIHLMSQFGEPLRLIAKNKSFPKLGVLSEWVSPSKFISRIDYCENTFKELVGNIKHQIDSNDDEIKVSPSLVTTLRILKELCVPTQRCCRSSKEFTRQLKYYYGSMQVFSLDGMSRILALLNRLSTFYLKPPKQAFALVGVEGILVASCISASIKIIKQILKHLIRVRRDGFKDISPIPILVKVYSLLFIFPSSCPVNVQEITQDIIESLNLYTDLSLTEPGSEEEVLRKSVWTKMINEVVQYTFSLPMCFIHGLSLLSELLPLPLPLQALKPLSEEEVMSTINIRKLWSAHLLILNNDLEMLISNFVLCSSPIIQQLLRRVCIQISDLSSLASTLVVRCVLDVLLVTINEEKTINDSLIYVLDLLSYLLSHPPFKSALIHSLHIGGKLDEKYSTIVTKLVGLICFKQTSQCSNNLNDLLLSIFHSLCDFAINMNPQVPNVNNLQILSNSLPPKESLNVIISNLLHNMDCCKLNFVSSIFGIFSVLSEHDYGFLLIKQCIFSKEPSVIYKFFVNIENMLLTNELKLSDLRMMETFIEFIRLFFLCEDDHPTNKRTLKLNCAEMCSILEWSKVDEINETSQRIKSEEFGFKEIKAEQDDKLVYKDESMLMKNKNNFQRKEEINKMAKLECMRVCENQGADYMIKKTKEIRKFSHPLKSIANFLDASDCIGSLMMMKRTIKKLIDELKRPQDINNATEIIQEINLPCVEPLQLQFSSREIFTIVEIADQEKLSPSYWLSLPSFDDHEIQIIEEKRINLIELSEKYISNDFNLKKALEEVYKYQELNGNSIEKDESLMKKNEKTKETKNSIKKFATPTRTRGFVRPGALHSSKANDPFRSRPPNTSRPPSMHVDDFLALEQGNTNNNFDQTKRSNKRQITNTRSFGSTIIGRSESPYYSDYSSRNAPRNGSSRPFQRYSRENYSPPNRNKSSSTGPTSNTQHWAKSVTLNRRDSRESRQGRSFAR